MKLKMERNQPAIVEVRRITKHYFTLRYKDFKGKFNFSLKQRLLFKLDDYLTKEQYAEVLCEAGKIGYFDEIMIIIT